MRRARYHDDLHLIAVDDGTAVAVLVNVLEHVQPGLRQEDLAAAQTGDGEKMRTVLHVEPLEMHSTAIGPLHVHLGHGGGELGVLHISAACVVGWPDVDEDVVRSAAL